MNRTNQGPFKAIAMLWFPFSVPATVIGMGSCLIFYLMNYIATFFVDGGLSANSLIIVFAFQLRTFLTTLSLVPEQPGGVTLFVIQGLSLLALWSTMGLAICRCIALRLCRDEYIGLKDAIAFGFKHAKTTALFPFIVFCSVSLLAAINFLIGSLMQIPYLGVLFYILLPLAFVMTALMLVIVSTSILGAGMVSGAVAIEQRGTLDAWGKALNYIFARPLHVIIYMVLMRVFLVDIVLGFFMESQVLNSWTFTSLSPLWSNEGFESTLQGPDGLEGASFFAGWIVKLVLAAVNLGIAGLVTSFVFAGTTAMFLILRRDVDGIDVGDIKDVDGA